MKRSFAIIALFLSICINAEGQKLSLSTNAFDWAMLGTANIETQVSVSQHISILAGARYNPWKFETPNPHLIVQNRHTAFYAGLRYWPWYVYSGWWIEAKAQCGNFTRSGIWRPALEKGNAIGAGLAFGYTLMLSKSINIDIGVGAWGGRKLKRQLFDCPSCLNLREEGPKNFIDLDDIKISFMYLF